MSRMKPVKIRRSLNFTSLTDKSIGNNVPSFLRANVSRPMPMILAWPVRLVIVEVAVVLLAVRRGHQHADIFADDLGGAVAEDFFGRGIEGFDGAALVNGDDAFDGGFKNGAQPLRLVAHGGLGTGQQPGT